MPWTIPRPINDGYGLETVDAVLRTDMEFGSPRTRLRTRANLDHVTFTWRLTAAEMTDFRAWWENDIAHGASWFEMELDVRGVIEIKACKFLEAWKSTRRPGGGFNVSAKVEVRDA